MAVYHRYTDQYNAVSVGDASSTISCSPTDDCAVLASSFRKLIAKYEVEEAGTEPPQPTARPGPSAGKATATAPPDAAPAGGGPAETHVRALYSPVDTISLAERRHRSRAATVSSTARKRSKSRGMSEDSGALTAMQSEASDGVGKPSVLPGEWTPRRVRRQLRRENSSHESKARTWVDKSPRMLISLRKGAEPPGPSTMDTVGSGTVLFTRRGGVVHDHGHDHVQ